MTPLSPLDALGPAFRRTREVLAGPFRLGLFLKIALVAALTQPSFYSAFISYPAQGAQMAALKHAGHASSLGAPAYGNQFAASSPFAALGVALALAGVVLGVGLWVLAAYLYCRLRFTLFDLVVYKRGRIRQAWSAYGRQAWRYFGLIILAALAFLVVAAVIIGPTLLGFIRALRPLAVQGRTTNPLQVMGAILPFVLAVIVVAILWAVVDSLMQDFLLPPMAIEDAPLESALGRFFALLRSNFGAVVVYILLRFAVGIGLTWILMLVLVAVFLVAGLAIFGIGTLLYHALWTSVAGQVICVSLAIIVGLTVLAMYLVAIVSIYGIAAVFKQSYAAYFFGGRYPELGNRLEPPPIETAEPAPPPAPPDLPPSLPAGLPPLSDASALW